MIRTHKLSNGSDSELERRYTIQSHYHPGHTQQQQGVKTKKELLLNRVGSITVLPKLRESKWFLDAEAKIFGAVVEVGFIVEVRLIVRKTDDDTNQGDDPQPAKNSWFGVVTKKDVIQNTIQGNKKTSTFRIEITSIDQKKKLFSKKVEDIWKAGQEIRINNFNDKQKLPHSEKEILEKVTFARKSTKISWHNCQHFSYWCRYGEIPHDLKRQRMVSDCVKWGGVGMGAGMLMLLKRKKSMSNSK